ncbi:hypothetical protein CBR_g4002 [Chara braunii]|uniref:CCHC-type domain-containing protein n=1 Tax=Chara braunii TaxID=69332 RepID=A0A388KH48_CHABU|nr:hypothetical protein CBR_g4002 [Chara braunii]|eukprot:GBG69303.1 hypothetical protein CBR_g4002 [Chara braunii]
MACYGDQRDRGYYDDRDNRDGGRDGRDYRDRAYEREPRRGPVTCFNCGDTGHYANQCTQPRRQRNARPAASSDSRGNRGQSRRAVANDPLESKVAEIGKSVAAVCQFVEIEQQKKALKERKKMERKEAEERAAAEQQELELKRKKEDKVRRDAEKFEEVNKHLDIKVALRIGELREDVREDVVPTAGSGHGSSASSSDTEQLSEKTRKLCISEKRKRGPEPMFGGSPPMEIPPKRTPRKAVKPAQLTERLTRAKAKRQGGMPTPKKTPPSIRKKAAASGVVSRLKLEKRIMNDLKGLDALVLQNICKDEGIAYNGKFESIFDIAAHGAQLAYGPEEEEVKDAEPVVVTTDDVDDTTQTTED